MSIVSPRSDTRSSRPRSPRFGRLRLLLRVVATAVVGYLGLAVVVASPSCREPRPADAVVVLGAAVWPGERPSPALQRRIDRGVELWQAGRAPVLVPTGGLGRYPPSAAC